VGTEDSGVILIFFFFINVISLSSIKFCLSINGVFFYFILGIFEFIYLKKYHIFYVIYAYFYALFFLTTLKYHKFLELKPKDVF